MKNNSRTKNSIKNAIYSSSTQIISLLSSYILRFVFVRFLSSEYLGISGLFTNILTVFSLAELGIGSAIVYSMYKPIANNDIDKINAYMQFYKKAYRIIALSVFLIGIIILPNLNFFIKDSSAVENVEIIYLLYLIDSVFSYLCIYKISILNATQKNYIYNIYQSIFKVISTVFMIVALIITRNFIIYLAIQIFFKIFTNVIISLKVNKLYPYICEKEKKYLTKKEKKEISKSVYGLFCNQIGNVIINGTDNIIISKYISLVAVGLYSNYTLIISALSNFIGQLFNSIIASVGNHGVKETTEKNFELFNRVYFINFLLASFCITELVACLDTFISLSFGKNYLLDNIVVAIILINFYLLIMKNVVGTFKYALGIFWKDKYSTLVRALFNLVISIVLAKRLGLIGVFLGTLISDILTTFWFQPFILFKSGFNKSISLYFKDFFKYTFVVIIEIFIIKIINVLVMNIYNLFIKLLIEMLFGVITYIVVTLLLFRKNKYFIYLIDLFKNKICGMKEAYK